MKTEFWENYSIRLIAENEQDKAWIFAYTDFVNVEEDEEGTHFKFLLHQKDDNNNHAEVDIGYFGEKGNNQPWEELYALVIYPCLVP